MTPKELADVRPKESDDVRHARVELTRILGKDLRQCEHRQALTHDWSCLECAFELGRRVGHCEAGAYLTSGEVFSSIRDKIGART